jgi:hypothetical protein
MISIPQQRLEFAGGNGAVRGGEHQLQNKGICLKRRQIGGCTVVEQSTVLVAQQ